MVWCDGGEGWRDGMMMGRMEERGWSGVMVARDGREGWWGRTVRWDGEMGWDDGGKMVRLRMASYHNVDYWAQVKCYDLFISLKAKCMF